MQLLGKVGLKTNEDPQKESGVTSQFHTQHKRTYFVLD